ncbi:MAG: gliding motility-associated C-terminal domain-containing protein, partial [Filimonas sp.]|nr:gliding motility-associated C-terminal domain-containing protein [Filimonas sp.]
TIANETNTVVTGLPAGVTYNYTAGTVVISGTPTASGTFNYTVTATGACKSAVLTGTIIVNPDSDIKLISVNGTDGQTLCINKPLITIQYQVDNATNITVTGLPTGVTYGINGGTVTITGTPTVSGKFNYQIVATGLAKSATRDGSITVNPDVTLTHGTGSENQGVCINKAIASITYTVVNATDIKVNGLPVGVNGSYDPASGSFTISGTPTQSGTYNYTVTAGGLCLPAQLTGKIVVTPDATIALVSGNNNQTLCINNNIAAITYTATNATAVTISGLPAGVSGSYDPASGSFAISGVPTQSGTFNYIVTAIGTCLPANINGVITVNANDTLILSSGTANQTLCSNNAITTITYKALHVKNVTVTGLPAGVTAMYDIASGTVTISGSPTEIGVFNYAVQTTQSGCVSAQPMSGTITVKGKPVVAVIVTPAPVCAGSTLNLVTPNVSDNGDAITTAGWLLNDVAFNAATPLADTDNGQNLVYVATNTCGTTTSNIVQITVNKKPVLTTTSMAAVCAPNTIDLRSGISNYDANNYSYTFTDAAGITVANPAAVNVAGTYTVVAENKTSYCGSASQTLQVKINPKPVVNVVTFTPGEVCAPSTVNIQSLITNYDATTYNYSYTDQYGNAVATPTAISASGNYSITATDKVNDTHCSSQPVTVVVTVNPQPVITVVNNGNMALCGNTGTVDLTTGISNYNAGYTYIYTDAGGNPLSNVSAIGIPGTYYVTAKDNKCSSVKTAITLTRYATPVVTITDPAAVYDPYTVDITAAAVTAGSTADLTYAYYNSSNVLITTADAQKISGPGSYTYYLQGTSVQGCKSNTAPVHVLIKERPVLSISSAEIWEGQKATLTLSLPTDVILPDAITVALNTRYPGSTIVKGDYDKPDKVIVPANTNSVTFVVNTWDNNVLDLDRILILEGGNTIYNVTPGTVLIHDSTSLKPQNLIITIGRDTIYGRGTGAVSVSLPIGISTSYPIPVSAYPASGTTINSTDYTMDNSVTIQPGNGSAILGVTVTNTAPEDRKLNLSGQSTGFVVKDGGVYIRQSRINVVPLVSDNGDGINDYLKIEGIEKYTSKMGGSNKVVLFNRWEDVIYEAGNYDNSAIKFDGRGNKHGAGRVPDGVYFYAITITIPDNELGAGESKTQTFKGYFRLQK